MMSMDTITKIKRVLSLAQIGLAYTESSYDKDRYTELEQIAFELLQEIGDKPLEVVRDFFPPKKVYVTPMVDVRALIVQENQVLMVKEEVDGKWSLPGGWADVGYTPNEIAVKESFEEAGVEVKPIRLLAVWDKKCHEHPAQPYYVYKIFIACELVGGSFKANYETLDAKFFDVDALPPLSVDRNTTYQIKEAFSIYKQNKYAPVD